MSIFFPSFYLLSSVPPFSLSVFKDFFILEVLACMHRVEDGGKAEGENIRADFR